MCRTPQATEQRWVAGMRLLHQRIQTKSQIDEMEALCVLADLADVFLE